MSILPGIYASQITGHLSTNSYESIATYSGGSSSITFSSIPSTYKHLQLRYIGRDTYAAVWDIAYLTFNGASSGYSWHEILGNGSTTPATGAASTSSIRFGRMTYASSTANTYAAGVLDILDYANTNKYKTTRLLAGADLNGDGFILLGSGLYQNTSAISSLTITAAGTAFNANSQFALYGIKG